MAAPHAISSPSTSVRLCAAQTDTARPSDNSDRFRDHDMACVGSDRPAKRRPEVGRRVVIAVPRSGLSGQGAVERNRSGERVRDRSVFQDVAVQKVEAMIGLGTVHDHRVADARQARRRVLSLRLQSDLGAFDPEVRLGVTRAIPFSTHAASVASRLKGKSLVTMRPVRG
jgi:hypothetical protein